MRSIPVLMFILLISFSGIAEARSYVVNFDYIGGVEVKADSPFPPAPKAWRDTEGEIQGPNWKPVNYGSPYVGGEASYSQDEINNVERLDGKYVEQSASASTLFDGDDYEYAVQHFRFSVAVDAEYIRIGAFLTDEDDGVEMYVWNWISSDWEQVGARQHPSGFMWMNFSCTSRTACEPYRSSSGQVDVAFVSEAHASGFFDNDEAYIRVDYIELVAEVPASKVQSACLNYVSGTLRDWGGIFDNDEFSITFKIQDEDGHELSNYPGFIRLIWDGGKSDFAANWSNSSGYLTTTGKPIHGHVSDRWRVKFVGMIKDVMIGGVAYRYDASCSQPVAAENVAITPGSYDITLVGRMYYAGGADWVKVNWYVDENSVTKPYPIPVVQKFTGSKASVTIWKYGLDDYCTDPNCHTEGIYEDNGYSPDTDWDGACIAVGSTTPKCDRPPGYDTLFGHVSNCYGDPKGPHPGRHDCVYFSGYRVGPFIQMNIPDHALGWLAAAVVDNYGTLDNFMRSTDYNQHEGPDGVLFGISTERSFTYGLAQWLPIGKDNKGGLGVVGFVGLIADNQHAIGIVMGHRYGIHPFTAIVTTIPSHPSDKNGWENYMDTWLYYLLSNAVYIAKTTGEELGAWSLRYPSQTDVLNLNRAFNDFMADFIPYLREVLWLLVSCGKTVNHPFLVSIAVQFEDMFEMAKRITSNPVLRGEFEKLIGEMLTQLPNVTGPPNGVTGLNYMLNHRSQLPRDEKIAFARKMMELLDQATEIAITLLRELPRMESGDVGWSTNWIAGYGTG